MRRWSAIVFWAFGVVCVVYGWLNAVEGAWVQLQLGLGGLAFGVVGLVLALRSVVAMAWLFLGTQALMGLSMSYTQLSWGLLLTLSAVLLIFPSGRLPSRRWLWAPVALGLAGVIWLVVDVLDLIDNDGISFAVFIASSTPVITASAVRIISDYRRAVGQTRQQLKWLAWILGVGGLLLVVSAIGGPVQSANHLAGLALLVGGPVAIGVAVTRYRLYEIDRIISRTVSYALVVGVLAGGVAGIAALIGVQFDNPLIVAGTTLGVAALFNPLRVRIQAWVERRFNRSKYDHERVAERFTSTLQGEFDMEDVTAGLLGVVSETMQPAQVGIWTRIS